MAYAPNLNAQTSVGTFDVTMETLEIKVKIQFFIIFHILLLSSEILIKISKNAPPEDQDQTSVMC